VLLPTIVLTPNRRKQAIAKRKVSSDRKKNPLPTKERDIRKGWQEAKKKARVANDHHSSSPPSITTINI